MRPTRVYLIDDHPVFRSGLRRALEDDGRFECVGEADDAPTALSALRQVQVDVVVVDLALRSGSGLDVISALRTEGGQFRALVLSMHDEHLYAERALRAGARGYLGKDLAPRVICDAVARVARGELVVSERLQNLLMQRAVSGQDASGNPLAVLSDREIEVFRLIAGSLKTSVIARTLHISPKTVESHRARIKSKLGLDSPAELLRAAIVAFPELDHPPRKP